MTDIYAVPQAVPGSKVRARELLEISIGGVSVLLDHLAAEQIARSLKVQGETSEIIRLTAYCVRGTSQILNFPLSRTEAKSLMLDLDPFIYGE